MYELKVTVKKVMGECTGNPPMKPGDHFMVSDGDIRIPEGGYFCLFALQNIIPLLAAKEREISEKKEDDWMWRVHHVQCPDPTGRVLFKIERTEKIEKHSKGHPVVHSIPKSLPKNEPRHVSGPLREGLGAENLRDIQIEVESIDGRCSSKMKLGDRFTLSDGQLHIPAGCHFCFYALQSAVPLLPAKKCAMKNNNTPDGEIRVLCPDPAGNVILRIDRKGQAK